MGAPIFADDHTFEVIREFAHRSRRTRIDILRELAKPLEDRLANEFGVRVVDGKALPVNEDVSSSSKRKVKA